MTFWLTEQVFQECVLHLKFFGKWGTLFITVTIFRSEVTDDNFVTFNLTDGHFATLRKSMQKCIAILTLRDIKQDIFIYIFVRIKFKMLKKAVNGDTLNILPHNSSVW